MAIRVFDCWYHDQDIREALERPGFLEGPVADLSLGRIPPKASRLRRRQEGRPRRQGSTVVFAVTGDTPLVATVAARRARRAAPRRSHRPVGAPHHRPPHVHPLAGGRWTGDEARARRFVGRRGRHRARRSCRRQPGVHDLSRRTGALQDLLEVEVRARRSARRRRRRSLRSRDGGTSRAPGTSGS